MTGSRAKTYTWEGDSLTVREWADKLGLSLNEMNHRIRKYGVCADTFQRSPVYCDGICSECPYDDCINPNRVESEWERKMNRTIWRNGEE